VLRQAEDADANGLVRLGGERREDATGNRVEEDPAADH
jgi:hypothetical protein